MYQEPVPVLAEQKPDRVALVREAKDAIANREFEKAATLYSRAGKPGTAAPLFEDAGIFSEAVQAYRTAFITACTRCNDFLSRSNVQTATSIWMEAREYYASIKRINDEKEICTSDFEKLSDQFQAMEEKMAPYTQAEPNS